MSTLLITHTDLDGVSCYALARFVQEEWGVKIYDKVLALDYEFEDREEIDSLIKSYDKIIMVDVTPKEEYADLLVSTYHKEVLLFDHHESTDWITRFGNSVWDKSRSGTKIFWEDYLSVLSNRSKPVIDEYVNLVNIYDLWDDDNPLFDEAKNLSNMMYGYFNFFHNDNQEKRMAPYINHICRKLDKLDEWRWLTRELELIAKAKQKEEEKYQMAMANISLREDVRGNKFAVICIDSKTSYVARRLFKENDDLIYIVIINSYRGIKGKLSFRSNHGFDCTSLGVAKGHTKASGGNISVEDAMTFLKNDKLSFKFKDEDNQSDIFNEKK